MGIGVCVGVGIGVAVGDIVGVGSKSTVSEDEMSGGVSRDIGDSVGREGRSSKLAALDGAGAAGSTSTCSLSPSCWIG